MNATSPVSIHDTYAVASREVERADVADRLVDQRELAVLEVRRVERMPAEHDAARGERDEHDDDAPRPTRRAPRRRTSPRAAAPRPTGRMRMKRRLPHAASPAIASPPKIATMMMSRNALVSAQRGPRAGPARRTATPGRTARRLRLPRDVGRVDLSATVMMIGITIDDRRTRCRCGCRRVALDQLRCGRRSPSVALDQAEERVFEPAAGGDRLDPDARLHQRGDELRARAAVDDDREPGRLVVDPRARSAAPRAPGARPATSSTSRYTEPDEPMSSATEPDATSLPLSITTAWLQICSTSASTWLEKSTVAPGVGDPVHELAHLAHLAGVETVGGLVEHEHLGPAEQHACEAQPLAHALRVRLHLPVDRVAELGDGERLLEVGVGELVRRPPPTRACRFVIPERCGTNAAVSISAPTRRSSGLPGPHRLAEQARLAGGGVDQAEQHPQARGLARAVRAEQSADLTLLDLEAQVVDREHARAEALREAADLDDRLAHRSTRRDAIAGTPGGHVRSLP